MQNSLRNIRKIFPAGPAEVEAARALATPRRALGIFPYQWLFPGPHSKQVLANASIPLAGPTFSNDILTYTVPDGMIFSLRGVVIGCLDPTWVEGTIALTFTLTVTAAGTRNVDFLQNINTRLGSLVSPYPLLGRLEFAPNDVLTWSVLDDATGPAAGQIVFAHLVGHTYPQSEAA